MAFASLTIDLNARLANIEKDLNKSVNLAALGVIGAGSGFATLLKGLVDEADSLNDLATRTGTSVRALASLQLAAKLADTDLEKLGAGLGKLSLFMANNAEEAAALGITARDPVQAFIQLADVVGKVTDPAERNALAMKVMGKSSAELMPLLAQGGTALRQQAADSATYADRMVKLSESAQKFNDAIDLLAQNGKTALLPMVETLTDLANAAIEAAAAFEGMDAALAGIGSFGTFGETIAVTAANISFVFRVLANDVVSSFTAIGYAMTGQFSMAKKTLDQAAAYAQAERAKLDRLEQGILSKQSRPKKAAPGTTPPGDPDYKPPMSPEEAAKIQATLEKAFNLKPLDDFIAGFGDRARQIKQEYAQLALDIGERDGPATGSDISSDIFAAKSAASSGDTLKADALVERAKSGLKDLASFEQTYYARQLQEIELGMNEAATKTAETTRSALLENLNAAAAEVQKMDPLHIPIAADAIANDLRKTLDVIRQELLDKPFEVPLVASNVGGVYAESNIARAALKRGAR